MINQDMELVREYAASGSEQAFETLVSRHLGLVYHSALRQVGDPGLAEEITQAVFIILARKAKSLGPKTILPSWLYRATRFTANNVSRIEFRRQRREQEAYMQSTLENAPAESAWRELSPLLEEAMERLASSDRDALVLRYFENKSLEEVGAALGLHERAAQKRVSRSLEKLRAFFVRRGVAFSAAAIAGAISGNSVQAVPSTLAKSVTAAAIAKGATAGGSTLTLIKGALKLMALTHAKIAIVAVAGVLLVASTATVAVKKFHTSSGYPWQVRLPDGQTYMKLLQNAPPMVEILPTKFPDPPSSSAGISTSWNNNKRLAIGTNPENIICDAYEFYHMRRVIFSKPLPRGKFDYIVTLSQGSSEALQQAIQKKFGVVGRRETVETNVLLLTVKDANAGGLRPSAPPFAPSSSGGDMNAGHYSAAGHPLSDFADFCENTLGVPVLDRTGLPGRYDINIKWQSQAGMKGNEAFQKAVLDQLGLELVPAREPVEFLFVEKAR